MDESQKDTIDTLRFEDLGTQKQIEYLDSVYKKISQIVYNEYHDAFIRGQKEIYDFSLTHDSNNKVIYTIKINDTENNKTTLHFSENLTQLDLPEDQIESMESLNYDVTNLNQQKTELLSFDENPNTVSLFKLRDLDKEISKTCNDFGMTKDELSYAAVIDSDNQIKLDPNEIEGIKSDMIDGSQKVSTYYTMNDITGMNYAKYQIIKTKTGFPIVLGITEDGLAEKIDSSRFQLLNDVNTMSLMQQDGTTKEVNIIAAFRIKSQSDVDRDQVIGLCNDSTSEMTAFYARGAITADKMIGENIPVRVYCEHRVQQEKIMDPIENPNIYCEAASMDGRPNDSVVPTSTVDVKSDLDELINQFSTEYDVDPEELRKKVKEGLSDANNIDKPDEEIVEENAIELSEKENENPENDNSEQEQDNAPEHVLGTPWGNPDVH